MAIVLRSASAVLPESYIRNFPFKLMKIGQTPLAFSLSKRHRRVVVLPPREKRENTSGGLRCSPDSVVHFEINRSITVSLLRPELLQCQPNVTTACAFWKIFNGNKKKFDWRNFCYMTGELWLTWTYWRLTSRMKHVNRNRRQCDIHRNVTAMRSHWVAILK